MLNLLYLPYFAHYKKKTTKISSKAKQTTGDEKPNLSQKRNAHNLTRMSTSVKHKYNHNKYRYTNIISEQTLEIHNSFTETRTKPDPNVPGDSGVGVWGKVNKYCLATNWLH